MNMAVTIFAGMGIEATDATCHGATDQVLG